MVASTKRQFHVAADIFPLMTGPAFDELVDSIRDQGLHAPIELLDDEVIDGRNRYRACLKADVEPEFVVVEAEDPVSYVLAMNLHRRHLSESQRAMVAGRVKKHYAVKAKERQKRKPKSVVENLPQQKKQDIVANLPPSETGKARDQAGASVGVSGKSVDHAAKVLDKGTKELQDAVDKGEVAVSTAAKLADLPKSEQKKAVAGGKAAVKQAVKPRKAPVKYVASEQLMTWLNDFGVGLLQIEKEYGSLTEMLNSPKFAKSKMRQAAGLLRAARNTIVRFDKEMQSLCPK